MPDIEPISDSAAGNLKERAYRIIRESIINGRYAPGSVLNEKILIQQIGTSRTPIREALARLETENLVRIIPQRGYFATEITPQTINDLYQVREMMEPLLVRIAFPLVKSEKLALFRLRFVQLDTESHEEAVALDSEFHNFILSFCKNIYLVRMMETIYSQNERIRILMARMPNRLEASTQELLVIIDAMAANEVEGACEAMRLHIAKARQSAIQFQIEGLA